MDNRLEQQRHRHEEIERIEKAIVQQYMNETPTHKDQLVRDHIICQYLERIQAKSQELTQVYKDDDGALAKAITNTTGPDEFRKFYDQLTAINAHHSRYPNELVEPIELQFAREQADWERQKDLNDTVVDKVFSGEESMGKYLDLYEQFEQYVNLKGVPKLDYLQYLGELDNFASIPPASKTQAYRDYLTSLARYLEGYFNRALPLFNLQALQSRVETSFHDAWRKRSVPGWDDAPDYQALFPLYCYACRKQYTKQTVYDAHLKGRKHQKAIKTLEHQQPGPVESAAVRQAQQQTIDEMDSKRKAVALLEALLT
ncbi:Pre-mRNA-splicing factor sap61, partial [Dimargaris xerosporica]